MKLNPFTMELIQNNGKEAWPLDLFERARGVALVPVRGSDGGMASVPD